MRRVLAYLMLTVIGLTAFSQSPSKSINMRPAYPAAIGEKTCDSLACSNNGLYIHDIPKDNLPQYEIGEIPKQTVRYSEAGHGFYVKAEALHSANVNYSYSIDTPPTGAIEFNNKTGRFKYFPDMYDYKPFVVTFTATAGSNVVNQSVEFNIYPAEISETYVMQEESSMPQDDIYITIAESKLPEKKFFNNEERDVYSISVSGKEVIFDNDIHNKVYGLSGREDIYELNLFADKLYVRSALQFPQTDITIHAKEIIFEDRNGVVSSFNTTPSPIATMTNVNGANGADAGNISLYVKNFVGNQAKRLILHGGKGQNSNRDGLPGNGGNGGTIISNIDISNYCDFNRGCSGLQYGANTDNPTSTGDIIGAGAIGSPGHFEINPNPYIYIHPLYIAPVLRQVHDAYINGRDGFAQQVCTYYRDAINEYMNSPEWELCEDGNVMELQSDLNEINDLLTRLEQGYDYFGNPKGWVPLLSFEVMLNSFNDEIDRAIPTLYLNYWLSHVDQTIQHKVEASEYAATTKLQEIQEKEDLITSIVNNIPVLEDQVIEIQADIRTVEQKIEVIESHLMKKARKSLKKRNRIKKAVGICKAVANVLPVLGPWGAAASVAINKVLSDEVFGQVMNFVGVDYASAIQTVGDAALGEDFLSNLKDNLGDLKDAAFSLDWGGLKSGWKTLNSTCGPLKSTVTGLTDLLAHSSAPRSQVDALFQQLCAESPEWNQLKTELNDLNNRKEILGENIKQMTNQINKTLSDVSSDILHLDAFKREVFSGNSVRDLNAMQYLQKMEQNAKARLLKYHYYLRKAYEYRLLKPYTSEFNLVSMFERFESMGGALGDVIDPAAYQSLASIFREVVSEMAEQIIDEYSNNYPEQSAPITIVIPREQLDALNSSNGFTLNFHEMGVFSPEEENIRIVDLGIKHIESHVVGNVGYSGYMDLNMTHEGVSQFRKNGQLYWFNHKSKSTTSPHTWGVRYDAITHESTTIKPSAASESLLYSILNGSNNIMLFSRPSAWADINFSKKVHTSGGANVVIDSLVLNLQYDFTRRPNKLRNIDITASDDLMPFIACSEADINGRSDGEGNLYRSYTMNGSPVTFTAVEKYGNYYFTNWTNRAGEVISNEKELTVSRSNDQFYTANYVWQVPILNAPDTIRVGKGAGRITVNIKNVGSGDTPMDWYVSDSLCTWVHVDGLAEGIDDGSFSFKYDANPSGAVRVDSLEILVPETDEMSKMIYIIQSGNAGVYGDVNGDGHVSGVDITVLYNWLLNSDASHLVNGDVDGDGHISSVDVTAVYNIMLGKKASKLNKDQTSP